MDKVYEAPQGPLGPWGELPTKAAVHSRINELTRALDSIQVKMIKTINAEGATLAVATFAESAVTRELWRELYRIVLTHEGSWPEAWGTGMRQALLYAVRDDRTNGIEEGVRHVRQSAARRWIRDNRRYLVNLDGQGVFSWVLGDL